MKKDDLEQEFDEAFSKAVKNMPPPHIPSHKDAWNQVRPKIRRMQRRRAIRKSTARIGIIAASVSIGAFLFGNPTVSTAFTPFYQTVKKFPDQMISFFFGNKNNPGTEAKTIPPGPAEVSPTKRDDKVETILIDRQNSGQELALAPPRFNYIPEQYLLTETYADVNSDEQEAKQVYFIFTNKQQQVLRVFLSRLEDDTTIGSGAGKNDLMETVQMDDGTAYFTVTNDGSNKLEALRANFYVYMIGNISKEEMVKVAEGISPSS